MRTRTPFVDGWRIACSALFAFLGLASAHADWIAAGHFNYTDRLYNLSGFTTTVARPVREADVQVYDTSTFAVLASGATNSSGDFSITVADVATRNVGVRVLSSNVQIASLNFSVVDDKNFDAVYSYHDSSVDATAHGPDTSINFGTMTMPAAIGEIATTDWSSQVFNAYDMGVLLADWIADANGSRPTIFYTILWNPTNARTGSFYTPGTNRLSLADDDAYDDPNILHEIGHYIEDEYGWSKNTGGSHSLGDNDQDPRLAYSEGFATFVSAAVLNFGGRDRPDIYQDRDSFAAGTGGGFSYSSENPVVGGSTNEQAVTAALYDLIDSSATLDATPGTDDDPIGDQQVKVWSVVRRMQVTAPAATSLEDFWDIWFALGFGNTTELRTVFASHNVDFAPDAQEPNDRPETSTPLAVGAAFQRNSFYRSTAQAGGDEDWFRFTTTAGSYYSIEVNGAAGSIFGRPDPEMWLFDSSLKTVLAYNNDPYDTTLNTQASTTAQDMSETVPTILWQAPTSDTYYVYVRHFSQEQNLLGRYGTYQIRVRTLSVPTPTITSVSEQRMLPGQAYQALVVGTNFSRGAVVTTNGPEVAVSAVDWIAPSAFVVRLTPSAAVANGTYSLSVTNPGGAAGTLSSAFEVNASAQPPVVVTEVNLSSGLVEVKNLGTVTATLTGWRIQSLQPSTAAQTFTFPTFTLAAGATVVVNEAAGTNTATNLFDLTNSFNWPWTNGTRGDVSLVDDGGRNVDFIRVVTSPTSTHSAPQGTGGAWMPPQLQAPSTGFTIARAEDTALYRTPFGLSWAIPTMPATATGRANDVDLLEDNDQPRRAPILNRNSSIAGLKISARPSGSDSDWFGIMVRPGDTLVCKAIFTHAAGNLNMALYAPGEESLPLLTASSLADNETIVLTPAQSTATGGGVYRLRVFGVTGAVNSYTLETRDEVTADILVSQGGNLTNGVSVVSVGTTAIVGSTSSLTIFTINNAGNANLLLGAITRDGAHPADFIVDTTGMLTTLVPGLGTTFKMSYRPSVSGLRTATLHIASNDPDSNPFDVQLTAIGLTRLEGWRLQNFATTANTGVSADTRDYDFDGLPNYLEFCLRTNPKLPSLPGQTLLRNGPDLEFTYSRAKVAVLDGVVFAVKWSDDLLGASWSDVGVTQTVLSDDGTIQQVKATLPAGSTPHRFVRLEVGP